MGHSEALIDSNQVQVSPDLTELQNREGELHLRFYVAASQEFALPAAGIREVISAPLDRITPIPNVSPLILGTLNLRGRVIWVADLGQFLGEPTTLNTDRSEIPVIAVEDQDTIIGLAVDQIVGMEWLNVAGVEILETAPARITPFLKGEWVFDEQHQQVLRLLDQKAILQSERWAE